MLEIVPVGEDHGFKLGELITSQMSILMPDQESHITSSD